MKTKNRNENLFRNTDTERERQTLSPLFTAPKTDASLVRGVVTHLGRSGQKVDLNTYFVIH